MKQMLKGKSRTSQFLHIAGTSAVQRGASWHPDASGSGTLGSEQLGRDTQHPCQAALIVERLFWVFEIRSGCLDVAPQETPFHKYLKARLPSVVEITNNQAFLLKIPGVAFRVADST